MYDVIPIDVSHVPGAELKWSGLMDGLDASCLDEDLVFVTLAGGICVDAGWYWDTGFDSGRFRVLVVRGDDWDDPVEEVELADPVDVARTVERLAAKYAEVE